MNEEPKTTTSIPEELSKLGRQLGEAIQLAWDSDERKRLQTDISDGLRQVGNQVGTAVEQARESETTRQFSHQAQKVASRVTESGVVDDVRDGITVGLASLNRELSKLLERLSEKAPTMPADTNAAPPPSGVAEPDVAQDAPAGPVDPGI